MTKERSAADFAGRVRRRVARLGSTAAVAFLIGATAFSGPSAALSQIAVSVARMLESSALVIEGRVTASESRPVEGTRLIVTCVRFEIAEILKGDHPEDWLELCFLGGTLGDVTLRVAGMRIPEPGETGIYFVESPGRPQVHPFYGGAQGHFVIVRDPATDEERVLTSDRRPVVGLSSTGIEEAPGLSRGVARGVLTAAGPGLEKAMSKRGFKQVLRAMLGGSGE